MLCYLQESQRWWTGPGCIKSLSLTGNFPKDLEQVDFSHQVWNNSPPLLCPVSLGLCRWDGSSWWLASPMSGRENPGCKGKRTEKRTGGAEPFNIELGQNRKTFWSSSHPNKPWPQTSSSHSPSGFLSCWVLKKLNMKFQSLRQR